MKILIDADACPAEVLDICRKIGEEYQIPVWTVANFHHHIESLHHIVVGDQPQAVDIHLVNEAQKGDIVITQDLGLMALLLAKKVRCLSFSGKEYKNQQMDFLLGERELKARYRRQGGRTKGPKKRSVEDNVVFFQSLERTIREQLAES